MTFKRYIGQARRIATASAITSVVLLGLAGAQVRAQSPTDTSARGVPPYCVLVGGSRGVGTIPAICQFYDYQKCLQAAADLHGNCVLNVDYHGKITAPGASWSPFSAR